MEKQRIKEYNEMQEYLIRKSKENTYYKVATPFKDF